MSRLAWCMELARIVERFSGNGSLPEGVAVVRQAVVGEDAAVVRGPLLRLVVQGMQEVAAGGERHGCGAWTMLGLAGRLPLRERVVEASVERPFRALEVRLESGIVESLLAEGVEVASGAGSGCVVFTGAVEEGVLEVLARLGRVLERPDEWCILLPLVRRELHYRLLKSAHGPLLAQWMRQGGTARRLGEVVARMADELAAPVRVEDLAGMAGMSVSSFHQHFKDTMAMSPLQYQKRLRLTEARRLMLAESLTAAEAAQRVGYESSSQFSREYAREFGMAPKTDVKRLRCA